jgi:hypothetical protein
VLIELVERRNSSVARGTLYREAPEAQKAESQETGFDFLVDCGEHAGMQDADASLNDGGLNDNDRRSPGWKAKFMEGWYAVPFGDAANQAQGGATSGLFSKPAASTPQGDPGQEILPENLSAAFTNDQRMDSDEEMADDVSSPLVTSHF